MVYEAYIPLIGARQTSLLEAYKSILLSHYYTHRNITWDECCKNLESLFDVYIPRWRWIDADDFISGQINYMNQGTIDRTLAFGVSECNLKDNDVLVVAHKLIKANVVPANQILKAVAYVYSFDSVSNIV